jgi:hypothetical protein
VGEVEAPSASATYYFNILEQADSKEGTMLQLQVCSCLLVQYRVYFHNVGVHIHEKGTQYFGRNILKDKMDDLNED